LPAGAGAQRRPGLGRGTREDARTAASAGQGADRQAGARVGRAAESAARRGARRMAWAWAKGESRPGLRRLAVGIALFGLLCATGCKAPRATPEAPEPASTAASANPLDAAAVDRLDAASVDPFEPDRLTMVETQIEARGITDETVLEAMRRVPRHRFVPSDRVDDAYRDGPLAIGEGQTISQPFIVASMTELLELEAGCRVLDVGTGSG